ncbi:lysophospholipid acyltransferase family protein [Marivita sp. S0852]|uniref:lysophospholipid acyltransferase family protein n=1 Tax=Marivita sp. S0852 TaxID=3373893 RepID=UPI0039829745
MSLRKRIEKSAAFSALPGTLITRYLALCDRTTRWQIEGLDVLQAALADGPVLLMMWHSRMMMGARHWPDTHAPASSLHHRSPMGRISGVMQRQEGLTPFEMSRNKSNLVASRQILKRFHSGISIVMTGDGPSGPAHHLQSAPLEWACRLNAPIFAYAFSTTRGKHLSTWDRMLFPYPFGQGAQVFARYDPDTRTPLRSMDRKTLGRALEQFMDDATSRADALLGLPAGV